MADFRIDVYGPAHVPQVSALQPEYRLFEYPDDPGGTLFRVYPNGIVEVYADVYDYGLTLIETGDWTDIAARVERGELVEVE